MGRLWILSLALASVSCAAPAPPPPSQPASPTPAPAAAPAPPAPAVEEGSTAEAAVLVEAATELTGIAFENDWIYRYYGRFRKKTVALAGQGGRKLDVITVELADHTEKILYFDITNFFGK
jgi:hypothetical protein